MRYGLYKKESIVAQLRALDVEVVDDIRWKELQKLAGKHHVLREPAIRARLFALGAEAGETGEKKSRKREGGSETCLLRINT